MFEIIDFKKREKIHRFIITWFIYLFIVVLLLFFINERFKYEAYLYLPAVAKEKEILIIIPNDKLSLIKNNNIYIKNKKFAYKVKEINKNTILLSGKYYQEVTLSLDKAFGEVNEVKIKLYSKKIIDIILENIWRKDERIK